MRIPKSLSVLLVSAALSLSGCGIIPTLPSQQPPAQSQPAQSQSTQTQQQSASQPAPQPQQQPQTQTQAQPQAQINVQQPSNPVNNAIQNAVSQVKNTVNQAMTPSAPTGLTAIVNGTGIRAAKTLTWNPVVGASFYKLYGAMDGQPIHLINETRYTSETVNQWFPNFDQHHWIYYVTAVNGYGESPPSNAVMIRW